MPRRNLMFYTHGLVGGGAERVWATLASGLKSRGHDVTFAVDFEADANRDFLDPAIPLITLRGGHARAIIDLGRLLGRRKPDVVLAAVGASNGKILLARALSPWRGALILSHHGRLDAEHRFLGQLVYRSTWLNSRLSARTVAVSENLKAYLIDRFHSAPTRTLAIPNGIALPPEAGLADAAALDARANTVLAMGRLVPEKGMDVLIKAVARLPDATRLIILGEGPERTALEALAARLGLRVRVDFRGYVRDPNPVFTEAKVFALASSTEAFGNVVVEALAHGLPVVATDCGGPREILDGGVHGRLVPVADVDAMTSALAAALGDPGDPRAHRARAEDYSLDRALDRYEQVIEQVLAERRPAAI